MATWSPQWLQSQPGGNFFPRDAKSSTPSRAAFSVPRRTAASLCGALRAAPHRADRAPSRSSCAVIPRGSGTSNSVHRCWLEDLSQAFRERRVTAFIAVMRRLLIPAAAVALAHFHVEARWDTGSLRNSFSTPSDTG
jgi:hypothetical protein